MQEWCESLWIDHGHRIWRLRIVPVLSLVLLKGNNFCWDDLLQVTLLRRLVTPSPVPLLKMFHEPLRYDSPLGDTDPGSLFLGTFYP